MTAKAAVAADGCTRRGVSRISGEGGAVTAIEHMVVSARDRSARL
jgi:hypothetical protein